MTNEQLYVLLGWIGDGLEREIEELRVQLADTEREAVFYDAEGRKVGAAWLEPSPEDYAKERGWELRQEGDLIVLRGLKALHRLLRERAAALR